ncbi:MAG: HAD family hydrolase [Alphaproteobacteria bacterium]|nr:HAD family hydrolase [Alphaproteobacteria bacterium]
MSDALRKRGGVIFDRDGTLNHDAGYTHLPEDLRWMDGAIEAVRLVNDLGLAAVVATNQSGVGRGYFDEAAVHRFHEAMQADLARAGARIDAFYHCPYLEDATEAAYRMPDPPDRKPNPGMLLRAMGDFNLDPARTLMIGDHERDVEAARRAGISGLLYPGGSLLETLRKGLASLG